MSLGSPGPFDKKIPSGFTLSNSSTEVEDGKTYTVQSRFVRHLHIFSFIPKSRRAILYFPFPSTYIFLVETSDTGSLHLYALISSKSALSGDSVMRPFIVPCSLNTRVKALVSILQSPTIPRLLRYVSRSLVERKLEGWSHHSLTIYAEVPIMLLSTSSGIIP